ncbi:MIP/aquaporin family protein [Aspergillus saccharolyticus JOP 1030-1]|uniref:Aquaporin n=1 Tax=Aspergillus saccharolyticus JOP 1030-1 TaxID=1450539 RepID=A0A318Z2D9_9EURO|nr:aquaporin [Aspergillus saccharolyticus JOP 1030-1]PYH41471.1 aquaporin [Aspergillus saccharolyticus JOP 1030-1]
MPMLIQQRWSQIRRLLHHAFSEFFGTMIMMLFGNGVVAQVLLSQKEKGEYQSITWGWGLGVMLGVYVSSPSGSHLNPAVTLASCLLRRFPWRQFPIYILSQLLGAMCGAAIVYANYRSAIDVYEGGSTIRTVPGSSPTATAGIFSTYPAPFMTRTGAFFSEFIASSILMFGIFAIKDNTEHEPAKNNHQHSNPKDSSDSTSVPTTTTPPATTPRLPFTMPLAMFFLIFGIGACFGWETGYAINLARDFGPRLVTYMIGYGTEVWKAGGYYFWIPMIAPFLGCTFGGWLYDVFLYTGTDSVVNDSPLLGLGRLLQPLSGFGGRYKTHLPSRRRRRRQVRADAEESPV